MEATLAGRCRASFLPRDRQRGVEYYREGLVTIETQFDDGVLAYAFGSAPQPYVVRLQLDCIPEGRVEVSCSCPHFADGHLCKHLWATILEFDDEFGLRFEDLDDLVVQRFHAKPIPTAPQARGRVAGGVAAKGVVGHPPQNGRPDWERQLSHVRTELAHTLPLPPENGEAGTAERAAQQHWFLVDLARLSAQAGANFQLSVYQCQQLPDGAWNVPKLLSLTQRELRSVSDPEEQRLLAMLLAANDGLNLDDAELLELPYFDAGISHFAVPAPLVDELLPRLAATGRLAWTSRTGRGVDPRSVHPLGWDPGPAWAVKLRLAAHPSQADALGCTARLVRAGDEVDLADVVAAFHDGLILFPDRLARLSPHETPWVNALRSRPVMEVREQDFDAFLSQLTTLPRTPELEIDERLGITIEVGQPQGKLVVDSAPYHRSQLVAHLILRYRSREIPLPEPSDMIWDSEARRILRRDAMAEARLAHALDQLGLQPQRDHRFDQSWQFPADRLPEIVTQLAASGWTIVAQGRLIRGGGEFSGSVATGIDWFDVHASVKFDGASAALPELLEAFRQRRQFVVLDDGSQGVLPEEWIQRYAPLLEIAEQQGESFRFRKCQALLLDALVAEQATLSCDRDFTEYCDRLQRFSGIESATAPSQFVGELRPYQEEGLAWLGFLQDFHLGGCLADDMGLGKTVQVLALLQARRQTRSKRRKPHRTSLVVVPKSLVFNWLEEAARFTPQLRLIDYTGPQRHDRLAELAKADVVLTTYGTLRRDILELKPISFDYAILDEATAIKNHHSQASKAARLIQADHRLAMTGTPVENHLGELWSLFEFLNPGMLGRQVSFRQLLNTSAEDEATLATLRAALRPFILRRTKEQVLTELPEKTEQTLYCDMTARQRRHYHELRDHYRAQVTDKVNRLGLKRSKIHVLEALLRLRQIACDPRLLDPQETSGAKLELLLERLEEVVERGHKALVFSQFTSLLALVRESVEARGWDFEYLDGRTRARAEHVHRFQSDAGCQLFLISLKAGGHGLNLTAADYVFILDPWWNPAVEAQAIDRAHRLGQTRRVVAYRIICRDTVEDKIVQLQQTKREVAEAIISADQSLISRLTADDLRLLLN